MRTRTLAVLLALVALAAGCARSGARLRFDTVVLGLHDGEFPPPLASLHGTLSDPATTAMLVGTDEEDLAEIRRLTLSEVPRLEGDEAAWQTLNMDDQILVAVFCYVATTFSDADRPLEIRSIRQVGREVQLTASQAAPLDPAALRMRGNKYTYHVIAIARKQLVQRGELEFMLADEAGTVLARDRTTLPE